MRTRISRRLAVAGAALLPGLRPAASLATPLAASPAGRPARPPAGPPTAPLPSPAILVAAGDTIDASQLTKLFEVDFSGMSALPDLGRGALPSHYANAPGHPDQWLPQPQPVVIPPGPVSRPLFRAGALYDKPMLGIQGGGPVMPGWSCIGNDAAGAPNGDMIRKLGARSPVRIADGGLSLYIRDMNQGELAMRSQEMIDQHRTKMGGTVISHPNNFRYGYFKSRFLAANGAGNWSCPSWLYSFTSTQELDFPEVLGITPELIHFTWHDKAGKQNATTHDAGFDTSTRVVETGVLWLPDRVSWYVNDRKVGEDRPSVPLDDPMYLISSIQYGTPGSWPWQVPQRHPQVTRDHMTLFSIAAYDTPEAIRARG